jgi:hypothetical protein
MPDWKKLVRERLGSMQLPRYVHDEITYELAAHLEETYVAACAQGMSETEAINSAMQEVDDWHVLAANIRHARSQEDPMNRRTKTLWLPGLASLAVASLFLLALTQLSLVPQFLVHLNAGLGRTLYIAWLCAQIFFGALGAFLSRRAGGTRAARIVAATFPAIVMFGLWAFWIPVSAVAEHNAFVLRHPLYYALGIFIWVLPPALTLFLGAAPFLKEQKPLET